ncbi:hypothetical protein [uncultured Pseudodesulfovibrio sp.]|uniref:hypothetical protein n=1 Tax=uncultured Pseudodesulfovibrio sp. TaxID=2035858 RepID=UPI0029C78CA0|nr:hypothetical protein [uncultured Pseudodesulfovibrio sp.]
MKNWKIWIACLAIFAAGAVTGILGTGMVIKHHFDSFSRGPEFRERLQGKIIERLQDELNLPDSQMAPIIIEVGKTLDRMQEFRRQNGPQLKAILDDGVNRVKQHLSPEKQVKLDEMVKNHRHRKFSLFRLPPPPPPGP